MPVPVQPATDAPVFPALTREAVDAARTSAWYDTFEDLTIPTVIIDIDALGERDAFLKWIESESIFIPEDAHAPGAAPPPLPGVPVFRLPKLNAAIRVAIERYGAVFPKLNWTSPRDAAFLLPQGNGPLHCTSPADVYLLLKSSDFVQHDLDPVRAYAGVPDIDAQTSDKIELVLKKYEHMNPSREVRCFVRDDILLAISQRDTNFYEHYQTPEEQTKVVEAVREFFEDEVRDNYAGGPNYVFDVYLGDGGKVSVTDFQPYRASTDALLFSYDELRELLVQAKEPPESAPASGAATPVRGDSPSAATPASGSSPGPQPRPRLPVLRVIDSRAHPAANTGAAFGTNMLPLEMVEMSQGQAAGDFAQAWREAMEQGIVRPLNEVSDDEDDDEVDVRGPD